MHPVLRLISQNFLQSLPGAAGSGAADAAPPMVTSVAGASAVVLDSPHSGTVYPADFGSCLPLATRSEEHTSELQSQSNLVCRLLLEKKNANNVSTSNITTHH